MRACFSASDNVVSPNKANSSALLQEYCPKLGLLLCGKTNLLIEHCQMSVSKSVRRRQHLMAGRRRAAILRRRKESKKRHDTYKQ
jgi:hypothetical protein